MTIENTHINANHDRPSCSHASGAHTGPLESSASTLAEYWAITATHSHATKVPARVRLPRPAPNNSDAPIELAGISSAIEQSQIAVRLISIAIEGAWYHPLRRWCSA